MTAGFYYLLLSIFQLILSIACDQCRDCESNLNLTELRNHKLKAEKAKILRSLGISQRPNVSISQENVPAYLRRKHLNNTPEAELGSKFAPNTTEPPKEHYIIGTEAATCQSSELCFAFNLERKIFRQNIVDSKMILVVRNSTRNQHKISVSYGTDLNIQTTVNMSSEWTEINLSQIVNKWIENFANRTRVPRSSNSRKELRVKCLTCQGNSGSPFGREGSDRPVLYLKTQAPPNRQRRKAVDFCSPEYVSFCCKREFYVSFAEIGWHNWIVQPFGYYANYCTGNCQHMIATGTYTQITQAVAGTRRARGQPVHKEFVPCCSPTKMTPLTLLYTLSDGEFVTKTIDNMIVQSCGCSD